MEQVLYVLGAGFSARLGVPTMAGFIEAARDMYREDRARFSHFNAVFEDIGRVARLKQWAASDLHNLEEVFSILEMEDFVNETHRADGLWKFIVDVIRNRTPKATVGIESMKGGNWAEYVLGEGPWHPGYIAFALSLLGADVRFDPKRMATEGELAGRRPVFEKSSRREVRYAVVSFNYDMVLEECLEFLKENFGASLRFADSVERTDELWEAGCPLLKLHGSVADDSAIVLPTWNKAREPNSRKLWGSAAHLFRTATKVRFLGFGFAKSDAHFEFLLKAALVSSLNLKQVDVICQDDASGSVRARYEAVFGGVGRLRFANADIGQMLRAVLEDYRQTARNRSGWAPLDRLEVHHESVMLTAQRRGGTA